MATGPETLDQILCFAANWANENGKDPTTILLPLRMAWDLAKCRREDVGELAENVMRDGVIAFEQFGLFGLQVRIVREKDAQLEME